MMAERKKEVLVGVTVSVGLLILIFGLIWGKGMELFSQRAYLTVRFDDVRGLEKGDPVIVRGMKKGGVDRVVLGTEFVEVGLWVRKDVALFSDMRVFLEDRELMGGKQVAIDPGRSGQPVDDGRIFCGETRGDIRRVLETAGKMVSRADSVLIRLEFFLDEHRFERLLESVEEATNQARDLLAENRRNIRRTVKRLDELTQRFEEDSTAVRLGGVVTKLDSTICTLKRIVLQMEGEEGTLGKLLQDRWLYDQLLKTTADLDSLIVDIKTHPKRYFHVSVF